MPEKSIELTRVITDLRSELEKAIAEGKDKDLRFLLKEIEVDLKCSIKTEAGSGIGAKFMVLSAGLKDKDTEQYAHTVKLKLKPVDKHGKRKLISDKGKVK